MFLVGASGGGMDALDAAAQLAGIAGLIDISGDVNDTGAEDHALAKRIRTPSLLAVAPDDPHCSIASLHSYYAEIPARTKRFVVESATPGRHGWDLLLDDSGRPLALATTLAHWVAGDLG